jgi:hypothetical protein
VEEVNDMDDDEDRHEQPADQESGLARVTLDKLEQMPRAWTPRDHTPVGTEPVKLDAKSKSIADAFDVNDQKMDWIGEAIYVMNSNLLKTFDVAEEGRRRAFAANRRLDRQLERPYHTLWALVRAGLGVAITVAITLVIERVLKKGP